MRLAERKIAELIEQLDGNGGMTKGQMTQPQRWLTEVLVAVGWVVRVNQPGTQALYGSSLEASYWAKRKLAR